MSNVQKPEEDWFEEDWKKVPAEIRRGWRVEQRMYELGYSTVREFSKDMDKNCPEAAVSEDTILNLIKGKGAQMSTMIRIAKCLRVPVPFVTEEEIPLLDEHLEEMYHDSEGLEERRKLWRESVVEKRKAGKERKGRSRLLNLYNTAKCFFANTDRGDEEQNRLQGRVFTYADLILYLPLCDPRILLDSLQRIGGEIAGYEEYIIDQFSYVYGHISDIPAKKFADHQLEYLQLARKGNLTPEEQKKKTELQTLWRTKEEIEGWRQYRSILERWNQFFGESAVKLLWESMFPELCKV